jgi:hypothetical protein
MAKLSARGRRELVRMVHETDKPKSDQTTWERRTYCLMSDGHLLRKDDVRFKPGPYDAGPYLHSWGWKDQGKAKPGMTADQFQSICEAKGYRREVAS